MSQPKVEFDLVQSESLKFAAHERLKREANAKGWPRDALLVIYQLDQRNPTTIVISMVLNGKGHNDNESIRLIDKVDEKGITY